MHTFLVIRHESQGFTRYRGYVRAKNWETLRDRYFKGAMISKGNLNGNTYRSASFFVNGKRVGHADYVPSKNTIYNPDARRGKDRDLARLKKKVDSSFRSKKR